jgi:hypothetical protein
MAAETKADGDTPGVITYDVPQEAEVALTGGEILLDLPGENDFRLKVRRSLCRRALEGLTGCGGILLNGAEVMNDFVQGLHPPPKIFC